MIGHYENCGICHGVWHGECLHENCPHVKRVAEGDSSMTEKDSDRLEDEWGGANYTNIDDVRVQIQLAILRKLEDIAERLPENRVKAKEAEFKGQPVEAWDKRQLASKHGTEIVEVWFPRDMAPYFSGECILLPSSEGTEDRRVCCSLTTPHSHSPSGHVRLNYDQIAADQRGEGKLELERLEGRLDGKGGLGD